MVESAYTTDLKSVARQGLRVQVPPLAPFLDSFESGLGHQTQQSNRMTQVITRTRDEVYHLWLAALRSGEYRQSQGRLQDPYNYVDNHGREVSSGYQWASNFVGGFCCLGVLCDLAVKDGGAAWDTKKGPSMIEGEPPKHFLKFMGLDEEMVCELIHMNDVQGGNFAEIADVIETVIMPALDIK